MSVVAVLLLMVIVVAATATIVTLAVSKAVSGNGRRPHLPPPTHYPQAWQHPPAWQPGLQFPPNPAHRISAADRERIMVLLRGGRKIQAIKLYRDATGAGLREAKEAVEHMERYQ